MDIIARVLDLRRREHLCTVDLLEALLECDRTRAYLEHGYESLWTFLVGALRYSNAAASRRYRALKCARRFPVVITWLREDRVTLSSLEAIAPLIDDFDDARALLDRIDGKSQAQVQKIVAQSRPVPQRQEQVKWECVIPEAPKPTALFGAATEEPAAGTGSTPTSAVSSGPASACAPTPRPEERVRVTLSLTPEEFALIERARALASRRPGRVPTVHEVLVESVKSYVERKAPKVRAKKTEQRGEKEDLRSAEQALHRHSRHIPAATREAVFRRDGEQCTFVGANGHRCEATHHLQIDHILPHALGGSNALANLRLLCGAHNRRRAALTFGEFRAGATVSTSS